MPCYKIKNAPMTLWDAKEAMGERHGYISERRPRKGQGHPEHPELWPEEVKTETETILGADGGDGFICGDMGPHCYEPGCGTMSDLLCDWPMGRGKTCDLPMCESHAREIGMIGICASFTTGCGKRNQLRLAETSGHRRKHHDLPRLTSVPACAP